MFLHRHMCAYLEMYNIALGTTFDNCRRDGLKERGTRQAPVLRVCGHFAWGHEQALLTEGKRERPF